MGKHGYWICESLEMSNKQPLTFYTDDLSGKFFDIKDVTLIRTEADDPKRVRYSISFECDKTSAKLFTADNEEISADKVGEYLKDRFEKSNDKKNIISWSDAVRTAKQKAADFEALKRLEEEYPEEEENVDD